MGTNFYFDEELPNVDDHVKREDGSKNTVEVFISRFSGAHEIYLRHTDPDGNTAESILSPEKARNLFQGLDSAMTYLGYHQ